MEERSRVSKLICAIDTVETDAALGLARKLAGEVGAIKLGLEFFVANGPAGVASVARTGLPIMLDLKLNDIPNTVAGAVRATAALDPFMLTVHATGGPAMLRAAMAASFRIAERTGRRPKVVAVTVLTSMDDDDLETVGMQGPVDDRVRRLARLAQESECDGAVASARELTLLRDQCGPDFDLVVPGIRPAWSSDDDQKRIVTPADAVRGGADYLVVGRPITKSSDPVEAARRIADEMAGAAA